MTCPPRRNPSIPPALAGPARSEVPTVRSPLLRELLEEIRSGSPDAEQAFWRYVSDTGAPLIEPDPEGDPGHRLVTFVRREDPEHPATHVLALVHTVTDKDRHAGDLAPHLMERLEGTGVWAISHRLRADHRASYQFHATDGTREDALRADRAGWLQVLDHAGPDSLNDRAPLPSRDGRNPASVLELPEAPAQAHTRRRDDVDRGRTLDDAVDGRRITVHLPPGHRPDGGPYALAVLLDGEMWGPVLGVGDILDNLHADGDLPPTVAVLVDTMGRLHGGPGLQRTVRRLAGRHPAAPGRTGLRGRGRRRTDRRRRTERGRPHRRVRRLPATRPLRPRPLPVRLVLVARRPTRQ